MSKFFCAKRGAILLFILFSIFVASAQVQTTAFTYQGRFTEASVSQPTNGVYNMRFALFDAASNGGRVGATIVIPAVSVVNGIFTVPLDFTAASFDDAAQFLEVTVTNTVLSPRQEITNAPYAITAQTALRANRAANSLQLGGIDADQFVTGQTVRSVNNLSGNVTLATDSNITITPSGNTLTISSTSDINNQTNQQTGANFIIDGTGAANVFVGTSAGRNNLDGQQQRIRRD